MCLKTKWILQLLVAFLILDITFVKAGALQLPLRHSHQSWLEKFPKVVIVSFLNFSLLLNTYTVVDATVVIATDYLVASDR